MKNENKKQAINWGNATVYLMGRAGDGFHAILHNPLNLFLPVSCVLSVLLFVALVTASAIPMDVIHIANGCRRIPSYLDVWRCAPVLVVFSCANALPKAPA